MMQNQSNQYSRQATAKKSPPQSLGQTLSKLNPTGGNNSSSPSGAQREGSGQAAKLSPGQSSQMLKNQQFQRLLDPPPRKIGQGNNSNSPKTNNPGQKLFLKGFHQDHQKLFTQGGGERNVYGNYGDQKKMPTSTKHASGAIKMGFSSPHQTSSKMQLGSGQNSKKSSPEASSQNAYLKIGQDSNDQSNSIQTFMKRRTSEEAAQNQKYKAQPGMKKNLNQQILYQDYITQKSRSPQNAGMGPGPKLDYYGVMGGTQSNFAQKPGTQMGRTQYQMVNNQSQQVIPTHQMPQKSRNYGGGVVKYKTQVQDSPSQSPEGEQPKMFSQQVRNQPNDSNQFQMKHEGLMNKRGSASHNQEAKTQPSKKMEVYEQEDEDDGDDEFNDKSDHDPSSDNQTDVGGSTLSSKKLMKEQARKLWLAVEIGDKMATMKILQHQIANSQSPTINCANSDGWTPLHVSSSEGHAGIVEILIEYGAHLDSRTKNFRTPLHIACIRGNFACVQTLLMSGADADAKDIDGNTPAHFCAEYGHQDCLRFLLTRHPTLFAKNAEGKSPIDVAVTHEILQTFEEYIKSVKHFLNNKSGQVEVTKKNKDGDQSSESNSSSQAKKLHLDDDTLSKRATNKQIKITGNSKPKKPMEDLETVRTKNTFTAISAETGQISGSQTSGEDDKIGPVHFQPIKMLGSGSFGEVYLVRDKRTQLLYAMKVLSKQKIMGQNLIRYAKTERDVLSYTKHPFIVNLNFAFQTKAKLFLILDFCIGGDLGKVLQRERKFTEERARMYACEVLLALEDLHRRDIIYRDLKPDNVVLDEEGHALLTDFGLSKEGVLETHKGAKSFCGSVAYLAPEMLRRVGHGKSVDYYLLGVLIYEMVVGCPPYFSPKKEELFYNIQKGVLRIPASLSEECKNLIVSLLNRNPSKRLGAGPEGAAEIMRHPFFKTIDWGVARQKKLPVPKPEVSQVFMAAIQNNYIECTDEQIKKLYEDGDIDQEIFENRTVEGWSFVKDVQEQARMP